eukprot:scaffold1755_cov258-Ochromonas_danica.AAC.5
MSEMFQSADQVHSSQDNKVDTSSSEKEPCFDQIEANRSLSSLDEETSSIPLVSLYWQRKGDILEHFYNNSHCCKSSQGFLLKEDVTDEEFNAFAEAMKGCIHHGLSPHFSHVKNEVYIHDMDLVFHSQVIKIIDHFVCYDYNKRINQGDMLNPIHIHPRRTPIAFAENAILIPDAVYHHMNNDLLSLIVEAGFADNIAHLHHVVHDIYMKDPRVRMAIAIKIDSTPHFENSDVAILALVYLREERRINIQVVNLGSIWPCPELSKQLQEVAELSQIPVMLGCSELVVPSAAMFHGAEADLIRRIEAGTPNNELDCLLNVETIRRECLEGFRSSKEHFLHETAKC